jgi:hypothetical protein
LIEKKETYAINSACVDSASRMSNFDAVTGSLPTVSQCSIPLQPSPEGSHSLAFAERPVMAKPGRQRVPLITTGLPLKPAIPQFRSRQFYQSAHG